MRRGLSNQWNSEHGRKIVHRFWITAWWHCFELNRKRDVKRHVYACHWAQWYYDGRIGKKHYHVGRPKVKGATVKEHKTQYVQVRGRHSVVWKFGWFCTCGAKSKGTPWYSPGLAEIYGRQHEKARREY